MKKRILAFMTMVMLLAGILAMVPSADAASDRYQVGYAIKDVNPYIYADGLGFGVTGVESMANDESWTGEVTVQNPETKTSTTLRMIKVPMSGYANSAERPSNAIMDDNGDGYTGIGDGLHITATTVTDAEGTTLVYFTVDAISGYINLLNSAANALTARLGDVIQKENVFLNGSHSHEGADFGTVGNTLSSEKSAAKKAAQAEAEAAGTEFDEAAFEASFVGSVKAQLWQAYYDYTVAQMVDAAVESYTARTEAIMTKGSIDASVSSGYQLNYVRHYKVDEYKGYFGTYLSTPSNTYMYGSNFGSQVLPSQTESLKRTVNNIAETDDTMHILQFTPTNGDAPIILVNWRAHATMMSTHTGGGTGAVISADYIAAFRYQMQQAGYRFAFLQGAGGNLVANHALSKITATGVGRTGYTPWADDMPAGSNHAIYYGGTMLAGVALDCLENAMTDELAAGPIRSVRTTLDLEMQVDSEGLIAAAKAYQEAGNSGSNFKYVHTDGKTYIINSKHHARNVISRSTANPDTYADITLNAFTLGKYVTFVTAPTEMFDRYSNDATLTDTTDNDWDDLINNATYGTPFVMAYTNGHGGYTANALAYTYNEGSDQFGVGAYEANTAKNAPGEGEKIIAEYGKMIDIVTEGYKTAYCRHCKADVVWTPLLADGFKSYYTLETGHYYLYEDVPEPTVTNYARISGEVCLDLNGKLLQTHGRAFNVSTEINPISVLNIHDLAGGGVVESHDAGNSVAGGVINASRQAVVNLYGGTLRMVTGENVYVTKGGVVSINASTFNMYGGTLDASQCQMAKDVNNNVGGDTDGCGAAVALYNNCTFNVSGGRIIAGKAEPEAGRADCVLVQGAKAEITLSGDAQVDEFFFDAVSPDNFKIEGNYTGKTTLRFNDSITLAAGLDIGQLTNNGSIVGAAISSDDDSYCVAASGTDLILAVPVAAVAGEDTVLTYQSVQDASAAANGKLIQLLADLSTAENLAQDTFLDLNGFKLTGKVTVATGKTLYCMDSATDDYTVADGKFGYLTNVTGNVAGLEESSELAEDGYLMITVDGKTSFHRVNLRLRAMTLRACDAGVYFKSAYAGDEMVAAQVKNFGVALSVKAEPNAENLETDCKYSTLEGFVAGGLDMDANSTLLKGVMKTTNAALINNRNAQTPVWGRAYIRLQDGSLMFGASANRTFEQQVCCVNDRWETLSEEQQASVVELYNQFSRVMRNWEIPKIIAAAAQ